MEVSSFVKRKLRKKIQEDEKSNTFEILREDHEEADKNLFKCSLHFWHCLYCISLAQLLTVCISFLYMLNYPVIYTLSERVTKHARNCVYLSKIENSS